MRTALEVKPETAKKLRSMAKEKNLSLDELLSAHIPGLASVKPPKNGAHGADKAQAFEAWVKSFPSGSTPLSDEAISRDSIYRDR
jgi:hypothetical protein